MGLQLAGEEGVEQGLLDVQAVLGLVDVDRPRAVEHLVGDLDVATDREAVAKQRVRA
jgi:hypothetical protein